LTEHRGIANVACLHVVLFRAISKHSYSFIHVAMLIAVSASSAITKILSFIHSITNFL
jgi:hypothetical protein